RRPHLGRDGPRHRRPGGHRPRHPLGGVADLHQRRQVRAGVPDRGAVREGPFGRRGRQDPPALPPVPAAPRGGRGPVTRPRLATVWLDGCSGCPMSVLDMDDRLLALGERAELVYSPLVDTKDYPSGVDVCLVEGAVASEEDLHKIKVIRERTRVLVSFGDCAVTANVPGMRNPIGPGPLLERAYLENASDHPQLPSEVVPELLPAALPVHRVVEVDVFLPGCPPSADLIWFTVNELLEGRVPDTAHIAPFGA